MIRPTIEASLGLFAIGAGTASMAAQADGLKEWTAFACVLAGFLALLHFVLKKHPQDLRAMMNAVRNNSEVTADNSTAIRELAESIGRAVNKAQNDRDQHFAEVKKTLAEHGDKIDRIPKKAPGRG